MPRPSDNTIWDVIASRKSGQREAAPPHIKRRRRELIQHWSASVQNYFEAVDETTTEVALPDGTVHHFPNGRPLVWTKDETDDKRPEKTFPSRVEMPHVYALAEELLDPSAKIVAGDKARQVLYTLTVAQVCAWIAMTRRYRNIVWSKITEEEAVLQLEDKIRTPWRLLPEWVKAEWPLAASPRNELRYTKTGSRIMAVTQNVAAGKARGISASVVVIDEAAFQPYTNDILGAVKPMATRVWLMSTPNVGTDAQAMSELVHLPTAKLGKNHSIPDFTVRWVSSNTKIVKVLHRAIPARRNPAWWAALADLYNPLRERAPSYRRENLADWTVGTGKGYVAAEFAANGGPDRYYLEGKKRAVRNGRRVVKWGPTPIVGRDIVRGRDFGERRPACVWMQTVQTPWELPSGRVITIKRLHVIREWLGDHISAYDARDVTSYLSGQIDKRKLRRGGIEEVERINAMGGKPWPTAKSPWFAPHRHRFLDWASWEATKTSSTSETHSREKSEAHIYEAGGVSLQMFWADPAAMGQLLRLLLMDQPDGLPGLLVSRHCGLILEALQGGLEYKKPTADNPHPEVWKKDGVYDNVIEAMMHAASNLISLNDLANNTEADAVESAGLEGRSRVFTEGGDGEWAGYDGEQEGGVGWARLE